MSAFAATIVVPLGPQPAAAERCLAALAGLADEPSFNVVIVDNATVGLETLLGGLDGDLQVVRLDQPVTLAAACVAGIRCASGEHVVLLAGPAEAGPGLVSGLIGALRADPSLNVAAAGPAPDPVAACALAWRAGAVDAVPDVPDELVIAALVARLGDAQVIPDAIARPPAPRGAAPLPPLGGQPVLSVVIPTLDAAGERTRRCVQAVQAATDAPHEIILVDNGAPPQGFAAPVNAGLRAARGDYLVVCNDDVEVLPGWWAPLQSALDAGHPVAFPLTIDGAMRTDFAAWCFALSRDTLARHGHSPEEFLHPELRVWYQDTLLLEQLQDAGTPPLLVAESRIRHGLSQTVATTDPALRAWIDQQIAADRDRFADLRSSRAETRRSNSV